MEGFDILYTHSPYIHIIRQIYALNQYQIFHLYNAFFIKANFDLRPSALSILLLIHVPPLDNIFETVYVNLLNLDFIWVQERFSERTFLGLKNSKSFEDYDIYYFIYIYLKLA